MDKPEWFKIIDALDSSTESVTPGGSRGTRTTRATHAVKRIAATGAAVFIVVGGLAFVQSNSNSPSSEALSSVSAASSPTASTTTTPAAGSTSTARPAISGGAALGDD